MIFRSIKHTVNIWKRSEALVVGCTLILMSSAFCLSGLALRVLSEWSTG